MYSFVYLNTKTGRKVYSHIQLNDGDLKLLKGIKKVVIDTPYITKYKSKKKK